MHQNKTEQGTSAFFFPPPPSIARPVIGQHAKDAQMLAQSRACALTKK